MLRESIKLILILLVVGIPAAAMTGKVVKMEFGPNYGTIVHIDIEGSSTTQCANNPYGFDFSFDAGTESGKIVFSALLAAQSRNVAVTVSGTGFCTVNSWGGNTEDLRFIQTHN